MRKKVFYLGSAILALFFGMGLSVLNSGGKAGKTGSPGEGTCENCHSGGSGTTTIGLNSTPPMVGGEYQPNTTYRIQISVANQNYNNFGFDCEILDVNNNDAGTMSNPGTGVKFMLSGSRNNATHTAPKSGSGGFTTFEFDWTAPASGKATFYIAANAVNLNGSTSGDKPTNTSFTFNPATPSSLTASVQNANIHIYPNPCKKDFQLQMNDIPQKIYLFDMVGNSYELSFQPQGNTYKVHLIDDLAQGSYLVQIKTKSNQILYRKIYVNP